MTPENVNFDHIVAVNDGGLHEIDNIQAVRVEVNVAKNTFSVELFEKICRAVTAHADRAQGT